MSINVKALPTRGHRPEAVLSVLERIRDEDVAWKEGKVFCLVYHAGEQLEDLLKQAYTTYFLENGLNPTVFPSLRRLESEVVAMTANLLGGDEEVQGNLTTGGTESILMAVKAAREWARATKPRVDKPEMVLPSSAHPAFEKASHYFGVKAVHVPVGKDFRADVAATRKAIGRNTILVVGSAPSYPQGVVDPIEELAALAASRGLLFHVDACVGGFMLPFVRDLGRPVPPFDFAVQGVTSMSVDLHKYGYAAKGASVVLYKSAKLRRHQYFAYTDWPGGIYVSPTMTGTRSGGAIAAAWAAMQHLGREGYLEIARQVMETVDKLSEGIEEIPGLTVLGDPHMSILSVGSNVLDVYEVGDNMTARGWHLDRQQNPASLHLTVNHAHVASADLFLADLREAARIEAKAPRDRFIESTRNAIMAAANRVLPRKVVSKATSLASSALGLSGGELPERTAAMYGLMAALPNRGDLETMVIDVLDKMTRYDSATEIRMPEASSLESSPEERYVGGRN